MPVLPNPKHEHVAQKVAEGISATQAYLAAYGNISPRAARASASRLLASVSMSARIAELQGNRASMAAKATAEAAGELRITAVWLMQKAEEARSGAMAAGQHAAAVSAIKELGILSGHRVEKRENTNRTLADMSDDDLARIAFGGGEGADQAPLGETIPDGVRAH